VTELETAKIIALMREFYKDSESTTIQAKVRAWHMLLRNYDYSVAEAAVMSLASDYKNEFMPAPGRLIERIKLIGSSNSLSAQDAWSLVSRAVAHTDWFNPSKQFDALPEDVRRAVGSPQVLKEWGMVDVDTFNTVIYSNFLRAYETQRKRAEALGAIPGPAKELIQELADKLALGGAGHEN